MTIKNKLPPSVFNVVMQKEDEIQQCNVENHPNLFYIVTLPVYEKKGECECNTGSCLCHSEQEGKCLGTLIYDTTVIQNDFVLTPLRKIGPNDFMPKPDISSFRLSPYGALPDSIDLRDVEAVDYVLKHGGSIKAYSNVREYNIRKAVLLIENAELYGIEGDLDEAYCNMVNPNINNYKEIVNELYAEQDKALNEMMESI